ncbi:ethanolamine ammonia-lyase subunit EutC [Daeguia caeni]|uniref:Ethanolamine ammonia-lyase small subunit n=1 Tax=Daeguia caeni TaxID=439612 RepID=A0ABV9HAB0_9HYPH
MTADKTSEIRVYAPSIVTRDAIEFSKEITAARLGLGRAGASLPTRAVLEFTLDHARARDAVHMPLDFAVLSEDCAGLGLEIVKVDSAASDRQIYLRRPDLGRVLSQSSRAMLEAHKPETAPDVVIVVGDGLSSKAVQTGAVELLRHLVARLREMGFSLGPLVLASQARVALADDIGELLQARMSIMLIGERPGLSSADSLGAYLTLAPRRQCTDADRNCISNIRPGGLSYETAAFKLGWLTENAFWLGASGVALKDESDAAIALGSASTKALSQPE